jgi:hypothetical protein
VNGARDAIVGMVRDTHSLAANTSTVMADSRYQGSMRPCHSRLCASEFLR